MSNFFSNLLLRSSDPTSTLILRPRLPSLFESMQDTNTIPLMEADTRQEIPPSHNDSPSPFTGSTSQPMPRTDNMPVKMSQTVKQPKQPAQEKTSSIPSNGQSDHSSKISDKAVHSLTGELPNNTPTNIQTPNQYSETKSKNSPASILPENNGVHPPHSTLVKIEPRQVIDPPQEEQTDFKGISTVASELQESEFIHKQKVAIQNPDQPKGHFIENPHPAFAKSSLESPSAAVLKPKIEANSQIAIKNESMEDVFNPLPAPILSAAVLKPALPAQSMPIVSKASSPKPEQIQENEMVVQVHIGRIEVRAINAPISQPTPITNTSPQPKMSLDDYLHKRE